jgi:hypothetical protein
MAEPKVVIRYTGSQSGFGPLPEDKSKKVKAGETISFALDQETAAKFPNTRLQITISIESDEFFSSKKVTHVKGKNNEELRVKVKKLPIKTVTYLCELLGENDIRLAVVDGATGGEIVPDSGGS